MGSRQLRRSSINKSAMAHHGTIPVRTHKPALFWSGILSKTLSPRARSCEKKKRNFQEVVVGKGKGDSRSTN